VNSTNLAEIALKAVELHRSGDLHGAENAFQRVLTVDSTNLIALYSIAVINNANGQFDNAFATISRFIALRSDFAPAYVVRSLAEKELGRLDLANQSINHALSLDPTLYEAVQSKLQLEAVKTKNKSTLDNQTTSLISKNSLAGLKEQEKGDVPRASEYFNAALDDNPDDFVALYSLGVLTTNTGKDTEGIELLEKAVKSAPQRPEGYFALGTALMSKGLYEKALINLNHAIELNPSYEEAYVNKSNLLHSLRKVPEALETLNSALEQFPGGQKFLNNKGYLLTEQKQYQQAIETYQQLIKLNSNYENAFGLLTHAKLHACQWDGISDLKSTIISGVLEEKRVTQPFALMSITDEPNVLQKCAEIFSKHQFPKKNKALWQGQRYKHRKKRVAFISADFREHAVGYLFKSLLKDLNTSEFELIGISEGHDDGSELYKYYKINFSHYVSSVGKTAAEIALLIKSFEVDIAIDLSGFTFGSRLDILSYRPAPIQITYLGYPGTLSLPYIDYIIADATTIPIEAEPHFHERVLRMSSCYLPGGCRKGLVSKKKLPSEYDLPNDKLILCSFNHDYKINREMFSVWLSLLRQHPDSILWLMKLNNEAQNNLKFYAKDQDVDPSRIHFATRVPTLNDHLLRYTAVHLCLDTFPYNGHTTTYDALSMGVPVITLQGRSFQSRVASSLLLDYQLAGNITRSNEQYLMTANQRVSELRSGKLSAPNLLEEASSHSKAQSFAELLTEARIVI
jgi:predicted O-linked N-acetylglucosamine transferase (SPINDLY family)